MENNYTEKDLQLIRNWRIFQKKVTSFENKANLSVFKEIYGKKEGDRLYGHFINRCNNNYLPFETFLNQDQINTTLIFILNLNI